MSAGGHPVTDINLGTNAWQEGSKLKEEEIPAMVFVKIREIAELLKEPCGKKINSIDKFLTV
jgi:hypothetical protein